MGESSVEPSGTAIRLRTVANAPVDEDVASIIHVLQEHLKLAREGKLRSLAVVSVSSDGAAIGTQWSCAHGDLAALIGKLTVLTHDMMAAVGKLIESSTHSPEARKPRISTIVLSIKLVGGGQSEGGLHGRPSLFLRTDGARYSRAEALEPGCRTRHLTRAASFVSSVPSAGR
jgi:hypothetical protein